MRKRLRKFLRLVLGLLNELADQNAYHRYLEHHGQPDSGDAWRCFSTERFRARYHRPKCC